MLKSESARNCMFVTHKTKKNKLTFLAYFILMRFFGNFLMNIAINVLISQIFIKLNIVCP